MASGLPGSDEPVAAQRDLAGSEEAVGCIRGPVGPGCSPRPGRADRAARMDPRHRAGPDGARCDRWHRCSSAIPGESAPGHAPVGDLVCEVLAVDLTEALEGPRTGLAPEHRLGAPVVGVADRHREKERDMWKTPFVRLDVGSKGRFFEVSRLQGGVRPRG